MSPAVARVAADPSPPPPFAPAAGRTKRKSYIAAQAAIKNFGEILEAKDLDEDDVVVCEPDNDTSYRARLDRRREGRGEPCGLCVRCLRPSCGSCPACQRAPGSLSATVACVMRKCLRPVRAKTRKLWSLAAPAAVSSSEENKKIEFKTRDELMAFLNRGASSTQTAAQAGPNASVFLGNAFSNARGIASSAPSNKGGTGNHTFPHASVKSQCRPPNDTNSSTINRKPVDIFTVGSRSLELNQPLPSATNNVRKVGGGATGMSRPPAAFAGPRLSVPGLNTFPCTVCRLRFRTRLEMIGHRSVYHPSAAGVGSHSVGGAGQRRPSEAVTSPPKRQRTKSAAEEEEEDVFQRDLQAALRQSRREMKQAAATNSDSAVDQDPICLD
jgi:hypothetical protein